MKIRCSMAPRVAKCPASFQRTNAAIERCGLEESGPLAQRGTDIHKEMASIVLQRGLVGLKEASTDLRLDVAVRILAMRAWSTITTLGLQNAKIVRVELHLPCDDAHKYIGYNFPWEGTADIVIQDDESLVAAVFDYKSGFATQLPAYEHPQLVAYATLLYYSLNKKYTVFGQIIPTVGKMHDPLRVDEDNDEDTTAQLVEIALEANKPFACQEPGEWCAWCYAAGRTCNDFVETVSEAIITCGRSLAIKDVPDGVLADAYYKARQLSSIHDTLADELKRRIIAAGKPVGGYGLKLRKGTVRLTGAALAEACAKWNITADDLDIAINIKDIGEIVAKRLKVKKADGLSLVELEFGNRAVFAEGSKILEEADEETGGK